MTWFAHHVYAKYEPTLFSRLHSHPVLGKGLHVVADISDHPWYRPEEQHDLPAGGLIVVRELCSPDSFAAEWHGKNAISWDNISGPDDCVVVSPQEAILDSNKEACGEVVPIPFLRYLKALSAACNTSLIYYVHFMWGGDTEYEYAWIFGDDDRAIRFSDYQTVVEWRPGHSPEKRPGSVLHTAMAELGVTLPTPYFALHTGRFDWSRCKTQM